MDKQVYMEAVNRNSQRVFLLALSFTRQRQDAEDVMQTVFLKLWKHPVTFTDETHMDKWLTKVTVNESRSLLRARAREPISYEELEALGAVAEQPEERALLAAVMQLPEPLRAVIHLHYYEELTVSSVGSDALIAPVIAEGNDTAVPAAEALGDASLRIGTGTALPSATGSTSKPYAA